MKRVPFLYRALLLLVVVSLLLVACGAPPAATPAPTAAAPKPAATTAPAAAAPTTAPAAKASPAAQTSPAAAASPAAKAPARLQVTPVAVAKPAKKYTIGVAFVSGGEPFQESVRWAVQEEAKQYGVEVAVLDAGGYGNVTKQVSQIEDLVQRKVDAIMLWAVSYEGTAAAVDAAVAAGVPVVSFITPTKSEKVSTFVAIDDKAVGSTLAEYQGQALSGKGKVAMINGAEGAAWSKLRSDAYLDVMKQKYPGVQIVDQRWTTALDPGTSLKIAEDLLQRYPDLNGIYCTITGMAFGASKAVDAAGKTGKVVLVGSSIQGKDDINLLKNGTVAVVTGEPAIVTGRWAVDYTLKVLAGEKVPPYVPVPVPVYTKDNVGQADFSLELSPDYLK